MLKIYSLLCAQIDYAYYFSIYQIASSREEAQVELEKRIQTLNSDGYDVISVGEVKEVSGKELIQRIPWIPIAELQKYNIDYFITKKEDDNG